MRTPRPRPLLALAAAATLAGCTYQEPFSLPPLGPYGASPGPSPSVLYGAGAGGGYYDPRHGYVGSYGYGPLPGYGAPRYGYYAGPYPYYYGPGAGMPYPPPGYWPAPPGLPCADANRNGRCDKGPGGHGGSPPGGNGGHDRPRHDGPDGKGSNRSPFDQVREITRAPQPKRAAPPPGGKIRESGSEGAATPPVRRASRDETTRSQPQD